MKAVIILGNIEKIDKKYLENAFIVGVENGAYYALKNNIKLDYALGDFDSVESDKYELIKKNYKTIKLKPEKDMTDTNEAIKLCDSYDEILILGGIKGNRIEHFYANLIEIINNPKIKMLDDNSLIESKDDSFIPCKDYKYISFYSLDNNTVITLKGFKYSLNDYNLKTNDPLCISNEIINNDAFVNIKNGRIIVIYSKGDTNEVI